MEKGGWCAWQESNLLPHAPQACATVTHQFICRPAFQFRAFSIQHAALQRMLHEPSAAR